ncbi:MAG: ArsR/SmtB family transcription factor [Myxococcota bacterium]
MPEDSTTLALERAVDLLACMAHPVRLAVLVRLHRHGPANVGTLGEELGVEQSALSHHLRHLRIARLVIGERQGKRVTYRIQDEHVGCIVEDTLQHAAELEEAT